jgi:hypothetical protein
MVILKDTSLFNGHLIDVCMTCKITHVCINIIKQILSNIIE